MKLEIPDGLDFGIESFDSWLDRASSLLDTCLNGEACYGESLGWLDTGKWAGADSLAVIEELAQKVRARDEAFVLVGVGGSLNAARAVIEAIGTEDSPIIRYGGNAISPRAVNRILAQCKARDFSINIIAKNFETLEPGMGFRIFRRALHEKYGLQAAQRIIAPCPLMVP